MRVGTIYIGRCVFGLYPGGGGDVQALEACGLFYVMEDITPAEGYLDDTLRCRLLLPRESVQRQIGARDENTVCLVVFLSPLFL